MTDGDEPGKGATMLTDQLLQTIQAEREREIRQADRVRLLTRSDADNVETPQPRSDLLGAVDSRVVGRHPRPATDSPR